MKLYLIQQSVNSGYDTFDSAVVAAKNEEAARNMSPRTGKLLSADDGDYLGWTSNPDDVTVIFLGNTKLGAGVICASFNAG